MSATGPKVTVENTEISLKDCNFVQEQLALVGVKYALLGYVPAVPRNVIITVNGSVKLQGEDYIIDGRKIQFTPELQAQNDKVFAVYATAATVAAIPDTPIDINIPGQDTRIGSNGALQVLMPDGYWHDMVPAENPITGAFTLEADQEISLNQ